MQIKCFDDAAWFTVANPLFDRMQAVSRSSGSCHDIALPPPHYSRGNAALPLHAATRRIASPKYNKTNFPKIFL
jgi:hypothetical protein